LKTRRITHLPTSGKQRAMSELREKIKEIVELIALVPDALQLSCFEILLKDHLDRTKAHSTSEPAAQQGSTPQVKDTPPDIESTVAAEKQSSGQSGAQADITATFLHMKTKRFLEKHSVSLTDVNNLFYQEDGQVLPLYEDLGTTKVAEAQIRITLLHAFQQALTSGDFMTTLQAVRAECKDRKTYDRANFVSNFKRKTEYFDCGDAFAADISEIRLSEDGKKELANLIKGLK
jgi:hypothetical protein